MKKGMRFNKMKFKGIQFKSIGTKLGVGFAIIILLTIFLAGFNILAMNQTNKTAEELIDYQLELLILDEQLALNMSERTGYMRGYILYDDPVFRDQFTLSVDQTIELENKLMELNNSEETQALIDKKIEWGTLTDEVIYESENGNKEYALELMETEVLPLETEIIDEFKNRAHEREQKIEELGAEMIATGKKIASITTYLAIVILLLSVIIPFVTTRSITKPIKLVMERMKEVASGRLDGEPLEANTRDEAGQLIIATNEMSNTTRDLLMKIQTASETLSNQGEELTNAANEVKSGTDQVAVTMQELASGTETQANSASDLAAKMSALTGEVGDANERGQRIYQYSNNVLDLTGKGSKLMESSNGQMLKIDQLVKDAVTKVEGLDTQSQQISKLVLVIQEIADQTNLLALNAAIEAARAGEHGKGFAVVADEVRKLAEQVSDSVKDITSIVGNIQHESSNVAASLQDGYVEVEKGTEQIKTTSETLGEISNSITKMVGDITTISENLANIETNTQTMDGSIGEIASVSEEAAAGVEQVAASSEQTSSSMDEVTSSSEHLVKLSEELNELVQRFKL